jgi:hypothetical protein
MERGDGVAYFARAVSYTHKKFLKLTTGGLYLVSML